MQHRRLLLSLVILALTRWSALQAQEEVITLEDAVQNAQDWLQENVDDRVLEPFAQLDPDRVQPLLRELQRRFQGEYVVDLAALRQGAQDLLPLLDEKEETRPYAAWLRSRLDYLELADQYRLTIPRPPTEPGQPPQPRPNPPAELQRKTWEKRVAKRPQPKSAPTYVAQLKPVFAAQQVPGELVWLAEVESSFDPTARSPAGAVGLFQLMPATAKRMGLSLKPDDERLEAEPSARAASKYLHYLHGKFKDWRLALAAYNAGEGRVQELLKRHKARTFDAIAPHLPAETQMYVPKVEAVLHEREGVALAQLKVPGG